MTCEDCGAVSFTSYAKYGSAVLCNDCYTKREHARLEEKSLDVKRASDFSGWKSGDMSELFWVHLGKYIKEPNAHSISIMNMAFRWACHDNGGLANSFWNALKWAKIDLHTELERWKNDKK